MITRTDDFCHDRCPGNCRQRCGGLVALSVYETGYQKEPDLSLPNHIINRGFISCYKKSSLRWLCGRQNEKPPLKSLRMSVNFCALYCYSGTAKQGQPIAVLKEADECCCGNNRHDGHHAPDRVDRRLCSEPCEGSGSPGCVGNQYLMSGQLEYFVTAYDVPNMAEVGMPNEAKKLFDEKTAGWMRPTFPANDNFELKDNVFQAMLDSRQNVDPTKLEDDVRGRRRRAVPQDAKVDTGPADAIMPELQGRKDLDQDQLAKAGQSPGHAQPIVDPENTGVKVVDLPAVEDEDDNSVATVVLSILSCLLLIAGISVVLFNKKKIQDAISSEWGSGGAAGNHDPEKEKVLDKEGQQADIAGHSTDQSSVEMTTESETSQLVTTTDDESLSPRSPLLST